MGRPVSGIHIFCPCRSLRRCLGLGKHRKKLGWFAATVGPTLGPRLLQAGLPGGRRHLASFRKHGASQLAVTLVFGAAVRWLICQSLFCCLYWLLPLSVRAVGRTFPYSLSVQALVVWESGEGAAVDWSQGETSYLFLLACPSRDDADW